MSIATTHNLKVVEDCAQATGATWDGQPVGSFGDVGCFSFFPTKNLGAAGDGGAVTTKRCCLAQTMRELAVHGMPQRYLHTALGYNSRLDAIQAAVLNVKLPKLSGLDPEPQQHCEPLLRTAGRTPRHRFAPWRQAGTAGINSWCV